MRGTMALEMINDSEGAPNGPRDVWSAFRSMECKGTTTVGTVDDGLGAIRVVFCEAGRTIAGDAGDARRKRRTWEDRAP